MAVKEIKAKTVNCRRSEVPESNKYKNTKGSKSLCSRAGKNLGLEKLLGSSF